MERVAQTSTQIREALREIPGISLHELGTLQSGLIAFNLAGWDAFELKTAIGIEAHQYRRQRRGLHPAGYAGAWPGSVARISVSPLNNDHDIKSLMAALRQL